MMFDADSSTHCLTSTENYISKELFSGYFYTKKNLIFIMNINVGSMCNLTHNVRKFVNMFTFNSKLLHNTELLSSNSQYCRTKLYKNHKFLQSKNIFISKKDQSIKQSI